MTDYAAEQAMELEALEAILMDEFCGPLTGPRPAGWPPADEAPAYRVLVTPTSGGDAGEAAAEHASELQCVWRAQERAGCAGGGRRAPPPSPSSEQLDLAFAYPPTYPDAPPLVKPRSVRGLSDADLAEVGAAIEAQVEAGGGMPVMYAVVAAAQDWLREKMASGVTAAAAAAAAPAPKSKEVLQEEEEARAAAARALGTPVTPASFAAWASKFYAKKAATGATTAAGEEPMTGKQWFARLAHGADADDGSDAAYPSDPDEGDDEDDEEEDVTDDDSDIDLDELEGALAAAAADGG